MIVTIFNSDRGKGGFKKKRRQMNILINLNFYLENADVVVFWLDNDPVGENICLQIQKHIEKIKLPCTRENFLRAKFSSLARKDIHTAFDGLKYKTNIHMATGVYAREEIDLRLGLSLTNLLTGKLHKDFRKWRNDNFRISYGP